MSRQLRSADGRFAGGDGWEYTADCGDCQFERTAYESSPAHAATDRHESEHTGHNVTVRVDEGEDIHIGVITSDGEEGGR